MAFFASLPPELVEEIVELALPPFSPSGWKGRARTLKALCMTCKQTMPAARRLLYREMVVGSFAAIVDLAARFSSQSSLPPVAFLRIEQTRVCNLSLWGGHASVAGDVVAGQVVEKTKARVVTLVGWSGSDLSGMQGVQSLSFVDSRLQAWNLGSQRSKPVFASLHRLHFHDVDFDSLYDVDFDSLYDVLTSDAFPNLVSLALASCYVTREGDSQGSAWSDSPPLCDPVYLTKEYVPLLPQLRAAAVVDSTGFGKSGAFEVLEILHAYTVEYIYRRLPRCLRVLRLQAEQYWPLEPKQVLSLLTLADLPVLSELHLVSFALDKVTVSGDFAAVEEWCQEKQVTLFLSPMDDLDSFTPSFWRFLDGVKDRLGLDV
ncbi:hypothetical protein JCM10213_003137 [Rhodosporidiobolus nylandii]